MRRRALLVAALVLAPGGHARADGPASAAVETLLSSPFAAEREDGVRLLVSAGSAGLEAARTLCASARLPLRAGGWRVLAELGTPEDLEAALAALDSVEGPEALAVGETVLALAARLPLPAEPPLPEGALSPHAARALEGPVEVLLWSSSPEEVPGALLRLGSGIVPCLARLVERASTDRGVRAEAIEALAAVGGPSARAVLARLPDLTLPPEPASVFRGLRQVARGPGLERAQRQALATLVNPAPGRRGQAARQEAALFLQSCPPASADPALRRRLLERVLHAEGGPRGGHAVELLRAWLPLGVPTDEELQRVVEKLGAPEADRGWFVVALEPWKDRVPVRRALLSLAARFDAPPATAGWAGLLTGGPGTPGLLTHARRAIEPADGGEVPDARRLGLLLLGRLDLEPPADLVALGLAEPDAWCRVYALHLLRRLPGVASVHFQARACAQDRDPWVFAAAAGVYAVPWDGPVRRRLADLLLGAQRDLRTYVVGLLASGGEADEAGEDPESVGAGSLDQRLRLAARLVAEGGTR